MDPACFVFFDETGTPTNMARCYGRSASARGLVATVPHGHWRTTTFSAGLTQTGIVAPLALDGPMTGLAMSSNAWRRRSRPAMSSFSAISPGTRSKASAKQSPRPVPRYSTWRRTRPTAIRSNS
jgi:hypothetical protein